MAGLLVVALTVAYLCIAYRVMRLIPSTRGRALALLVTALIPTADAIYGRIELRQMCEAEGGLKIYKTVEGVEGLYIDHLGATPEWITKHGYQFVEGMGLDRKSMRLSRGPGGKVVEEQGIVPKSLYRYEYSGGEFGIGFTREEQRVISLPRGEVLARSISIGYQGGWAERLIGKISDAGSGYAKSCQEGKGRTWPHHIVRGTLIPSKTLER